MSKFDEEVQQLGLRLGAVISCDTGMLGCVQDAARLLLQALVDDPSMWEDKDLRAMKCALKKCVEVAERNDEELKVQQVVLVTNWPILKDMPESVAKAVSVDTPAGKLYEVYDFDEFVDWCGCSTTWTTVWPEEDSDV